MRSRNEGRRGQRVAVVVALVSAVILGAACGSTSPTAPSAPLETSSVTNFPSNSADVMTATTAAVTTSAATATPKILSIGGASNWSVGIQNGLVSMDSCGTAYNGNRVVNDTTGSIITWSIAGANFGTSRGTVTLAGRPVVIKAWQPSSIVIDPTVPWNWGPMSTVLTVRTSAGLQTTYGVNIVPAISTRIFGQCTYQVAYRRRAMGLQPSPTAFGGYSTITYTYAPRPGDQYQWNTAGGLKHTAIAVAVSGPTRSGATTTWSVTIEEMNAGCDNQIRRFVAKFAVTGTAITTPLRHDKLVDNIARLYYR